MTKFLILILSFIPFLAFGQAKLDTAKIKLKYNFQTQPTYFLDSVDIDLSKNYIDLTNIESVHVTKENFVEANTLKIGKVFITSKNKKHSWVTLSDFRTSKPIADTSQQKIFIIDGILISDTAKVKIETSFIKSLDILNMAETPGLYYDGPPKTVFIITTKQPFKKRRHKNSR